VRVLESGKFVLKKEMNVSFVAFYDSLYVNKEAGSILANVYYMLIAVLR